jgi:hypothetical protein
MAKKRRPREHIIADLSVNHVERYIFLCGYSVERIEYDYGFDLVMFTYDTNGEIENGQIYLQLKAKDSLRILADKETIAFTLERSDIEQWAEREGRTLANIVEQMVLESYHKRKTIANSRKTLQPEIQDDLTASKFLLLLASGIIPSDEEVIEAAREAKLDANALLALRDRLFS